MEPSILRSVKAALSAAMGALRIEIVRAQLEPVWRAMITNKPPAYSKIRSAFYNAVYDAVSGYLSSGGAVTSYRNAMKQAVVEQFLLGFYRGYIDVGAEEVDDEDEDWIDNITASQLEYVDSLFESLKAMRAGGDVDAGAEGDDRASSWAGTLDGVYTEGKFRGDGNKMLTMKRDPSAPPALSDPCATCARWRGKRRSAKKWKADGLIERNGNVSYDCGRWEGACFDEFYDDVGKKYSA